MSKKIMALMVGFIILIAGCSSKVEPERKDKKAQQQEQSEDQFRKSNFQPSSGKKW